MPDQTIIENPLSIVNTDSHATVLGFANGDSKAHAMVVTANKQDTPDMRAALGGLSKAVSVTFLEQAAKDAANVHPTRLSSTLRASAARILAQPFKALIKAGVDGRRTRTEWQHDFEAVHEVKPEIAHVLAPVWMNATLGQIAERTKTASADALAVLLSMRDALEIPPEMWSEITRSYIITAIVEGKRPGGHEYPKLQTPETPFATGVDRDAVSQWVNDTFQGHEAFVDRLNDIEASIGQLIALIATATEASIDETWTMLTGK